MFKALVVDDSATMRQMIAHALSRVSRLEVDTASDGAEALEKLQQDKYDILTLDLRMPVVDGYEMIARVRKDDIHRSIPVVVITADGGATERERALQLGANAFITKPIQANQVIAKVKELLLLA